MPRALRSAVVVAVALGVALAPTAAVANDVAKAKKLFKKGNKLLKRKKWERAIVAYRSAAALQPEVGAIHVNLARAYVGTGSCDRALLHYQSYLSLKPDAPDRDRINEERRGCVSTVGDVARLTVGLAEPEEAEAEPAEAPEGEGAMEMEVEEDEEESAPPGLPVRLDGAPMGSAPVYGLILAPGEYVLEALPAGGEPKSHTVRLVAAEGTELLLTPSGDLAPGKVTFNVKPAGAEIRVDGKPLGKAPLAGPQTIPSGIHELEVADPTGRHAPYKGSITVAGGEEETVTVTLEGGPGRILFKLVAGAAAIVDGEPVDASLPYEVAPGEHVVRVAAAGHHAWTRKVDVPPGETVEVVPQLVLVQTGPSPVMLGALGTGGAGVAAGITGAVFGLMARSQFNEISDRINAGGAYATPAEVDEIDGRQTLANVMLVTAVVGLAAGAGLFVFEQEVADLLGIGAPPAPPAPDTTAPAEEAAPTAADEEGGVSLLTRPGSSTP